MAFAPAVPRPVEPPTVSRALDRATRLLEEALVPNASCDAEVLLRHVLGWDRASVLTRGHERLRPADASRFFAWIEERSRRRPLQHITGTQFFWRHEFVVGP